MLVYFVLICSKYALLKIFDTTTSLLGHRHSGHKVSLNLEGFTIKHLKLV